MNWIRNHLKVSMMNIMSTDTYNCKPQQPKLLNDYYIYIHKYTYI